jgi:hypothetical protein
MTTRFLDHPDQGLWESLSTALLRHLGKVQINILEALESTFFYSRTINHPLTEMIVRTVLDYMASTSHAKWIDLFTNWAVSNGRRNEIFTVFELINQYPSQWFHKMNAIFKAGTTMGKVMYRPNVTPTESAVKFVPPAK